MNNNFPLFLNISGIILNANQIVAIETHPEKKGIAWREIDEQAYNVKDCVRVVTSEISGGIDGNLGMFDNKEYFFYGLVAQDIKNFINYGANSGYENDLFVFVSQHPNMPLEYYRRAKGELAAQQENNGQAQEDDIPF